MYPVYALCVVLCLLFGQYSGNANASSVSYFFSDLFMFPTINWPGGYANPPAWSLYVEVLFYVVLPLVLLLVGQKRIVAFCLLVILAMLLADTQSRVFTLWRYFLFGIVASELSPRLSPRTALMAFAAGLLLIGIDFASPKLDWAAAIGIGIKHADEQTVGLGLGFGLLLAGLPQSKIFGRVLNILPMQILGVISYSVYLTQFFYIYWSFPVIGLFVHAGSQEQYQHFLTLPSNGGWVLPLVFFPGCLTWGIVSYLLVERPGMIYGRKLVLKLRSSAANRVSAAEPL
ncbi:MAG: acyltransferase family protein [Parvibaculaceae bacterium]